MNYQAVIFDMDGVLIDSELYWNEEGKNFFEKRGILFTPDLKSRLVGHSMRENMEWVKQKFGFSESVEELCEERVRSTDHIYVQAAGIMPGAEELIRALRATGIKTAIASGSFSYRIGKIVERFGWQNYFDALVSTDDVEAVGKPNPRIYLHTAKELGVTPAECVVLEDSVNGVRAAKAAGMVCAGVLDERWSHGDYSEADILVPSLRSPELYRFLGLPI